MVKSRKSTLSVELSWVNFIVGWEWLRYFMKRSNSDGGPGQMHKMSSMYLGLALSDSWPKVFLLILP